MLATIHHAVIAARQALEGQDIDEAAFWLDRAVEAIEADAASE
ncbi:hypothetical protein [Gryllotalpicola koreensis]|uniref:Uncharacterized protein n=1 Tax=Gryllotalpicola koreensis TaxID=993086 RepID=A0ABP8A876_9MICO